MHPHANDDYAPIVEATKFPFRHGHSPIDLVRTRGDKVGLIAHSSLPVLKISAEKTHGEVFVSGADCVVR